MDKCQDESICVKKTLEKILDAQRKVKKNECDPCQTSCGHSIDKLLEQTCDSKNTVPFILYCICDPFKVEGVTTCIDHCTKKEKFICFTTFIFRIKALKGDCAILELLKFENHCKCTPNCNNHACTPYCQLDCEDVDDLIPTGVCITVDLSCFCGIQCLPAVCL